MRTRKSIGILTVLNLVGAVIAVANSIVVARLFGTSVEIAVYFGASTLLALMLSLAHTGQLSEVFLPAYHRQKASAGQASAMDAFSVVLNRVGAALSVLIIGLYFLAPLLMGLLLPGFEAESVDLGVKIFRALLPILWLRSVFFFVQTLTNAERMFGKPETINVAGRTAIVISVVLLAPTYAIWSLVLALYIGFAVQLAGFVWLLRQLGYSYRFIWASDGFDHGTLFRQLLQASSDVVSRQVWNFALTSGLSHLPESTFAVYKYVEKLWDMAKGLLLRPVTMVFFTQLSEVVSSKLDELRSVGQKAFNIGALVACSAFVGVAFAGEPMLSGLWGGEKFGPDEIQLAANILVFCYALLAFDVAAGIGRKTAVTVGMTKEVYFALAAVNVCSAGLAAVVIKSYGLIGALGVIAINTVALSIVPAVLLARRDMWAPFYSLTNLRHWSVAVVVSLLSSALLAVQSETGTLLFDGRIGQFVWAGGLVAFSLVVLLAVAALFGEPESRAGWRFLARSYKHYVSRLQVS